MSFVEDMRSEGHAVGSTCRVLTEHGCRVAARTSRTWRQANRPAATRTVSDAVIIDAMLATRDTPEEPYGRRKMTAYLRRQGHQVAHCTVDRLMRDVGMTGGRPARFSSAFSLRSRSSSAFHGPVRAGPRMSSALS